MSNPPATVAASDARIRLADLLGRVFYGGERVVITRQKRPFAALVSIEDLMFLEKLEDLALADMAREAIAKHEAGEGGGVSFEDVFGASG